MIRSTTVICIRRQSSVVMAGDGQVTMGQTVLKKSAPEDSAAVQGKRPGGIRRVHVRRVRPVFALRSEARGVPGELSRAAIQLAKDWRLDKSLRQLDALLIVADKEISFLLSGTGDVVEPDDGIVAIGSGGPYALAAARALSRHTGLSARDIALGP